MTSQSIEDKIKIYSTTGINNNINNNNNNNNNTVKSRQRVLMKEKNINQIKNNNILFLNRTVIEPECNAKTSNLLQFTPSAIELTKLLQPSREKYLDSDAEVIEDCDNEKSNHQKCKNSEANNLKNYDFVKKETPLLQIFDGNVVISQELSLEEVQNLLFQINSKLQNQTSVNSEDFPNTTFSTEENSDVEIIVETGKESEIGKGDNRSNSPGVTNIRKKSGKWNSGPGVASNNRNLLLKPLSVVEKIGKSLNSASTSSEPNFLISFKAFDDRKLGRHGFEHDYSAISKARPDENESQNTPDADVAAEQLMVEKADPDAELMQIEVIESSGGQTASSVSTANIHANKDGDPIKLPDNLESVPKAENFPTQRHRWNTNEEIAAILISFDKHNEWQSKEVIIRPKSGSMLLYSRKKVRYRRDGYCWKKRKDGKTTREDHMKLKVQGTECIYGCYVHSAILPTFHRRCYWLLQNPDIVLVHYLNVPYPDDNKLAVLAPSLALWGDKKEWTKEELISQLKPMFYSEQERDMSNELEISTAETVEVIVAQLMEKQRVARAASLSKQLECGCPDSTCADSKTCLHPMRRITAANIKQEPNSRIGIGHGDNNNQVTSTTPTTTSRILLNKMNTGSNSTTVHQKGSRSERASHGAQSHSSSLVLSLSQIHSGSGLSLSQIQDGPNVLILNNPSANGNSGHPSAPVAMVTNYKCSTASGQSMSTQHHHPPLKQYHHPRNKIILKHETGDPGQLSCCRMTTQDSKMTESSSSSSRLNQLINGVFSDGKVEAERGSNQVPASPSRPMDTCENSSDTILILNTSSGNRVNSLSSVVPGSSFYNETLDLSQEDIQRTLSANLPLANFTSHRENSQSKSPSPCNTMVSTDVMVPEINPMELMDSPPAVVDDDVFVNLDAFDMLSDFPELEVLDSANNTGPTSVPVASGEADVNDDKTRNCDGLGGGGGKTDSDQETNVTIVKDESSTSNVHADFRETCASITDFSPEWAYPEGGVKVLVTGPWYSSRSRYTVLFDSFPVPTTLVQSGVLRCFCPAHEVGLATVQVASDGFVISNSVMFEYKRPPHDDLINLKEPKVEDNENLLKFTLLQRLEAVDGRLHIKEEPEGPDVSDAFGIYHQSVDFEERMVNFCQNMTNRKWKVAQESSTAWTSGLRGMTLLHLAASLGYARLVCTLLHWRSENSSLLLDTEIDALSQDDEGFTPLMRACGRGHRETALVLYRWNHTALNVYNLKHQTALTYARAKGQTALANELEKLESSREQANVTLLSNTSNTFDRTSESDVITPCESPTSSTISLNSSKSHDGIFLRPDPVVKSESRFKTFSVEHGSSFSDRSKTPSPTSGLTDTYEAHRLIKRPSVDSGINLGSYQSECFPAFRPAIKFKMGASGETPKLTSLTQSLSSPAVGDLNPEADGRRMDFALCEVTAVEPNSKSPPNTVENVVDDDADNVGNNVGEEDVRVLTLAEQIIAAIPERIKNESEEMQLDDCTPNEASFSSETLSDALMDPFLNDPPSSYHPSEFNFEFSDNNYRYYDVGTPSSSLSPGSSSLQSPSSSFPIDSPSPPPTTQDFCEFFQASGFPFEKDFSNLTLSDREQRELYKAAKIIQKAYRSYKGRKKLAEDKERAAAILIQNYYRRYKQYAYFKQMTHAAMVIQNGYRSYCEHKRFKKSQEAALCIQNYYRHYKEQGESKRGSRESTPSNGLKRTYSQRRQHQAACKIQQFMRQSKIKLQKERTLAAERGRLDVRQSSQDVRRRSPSRDNSVPNDRFPEDDVDGGDA